LGTYLSNSFYHLTNYSLYNIIYIVGDTAIYILLTFITP